jgi:hypothetical protein
VGTQETEITKDALAVLDTNNNPLHAREIYDNFIIINGNYYTHDGTLINKFLELGREYNYNDYSAYFNENYVNDSLPRGYVLKKNDKYYGFSSGGAIETISNASAIAFLSDKTFIPVVVRKASLFQYCPLVLFSNGTVGEFDTDNLIDTDAFTSSEIAWFSAQTPRPIKYVTYKEYVQEADPTHTYDSADEVLTVKGNEGITRDLHVQGYIFQDDRHTAFLPSVHTDNIASTSGNINISSVVIIGDLD